MKVLINRTDAIGDTILTLPMAKMLRQHFPDAKLVLLVAKKSQDLFLNNSLVDEIIVLDHSVNFLSKFFYLFKQIKKLDLSHYFYVGGSHIPSFVGFLLGIKFRGGLLHKWQSFLFLNKGVRQARSMVVMHESEYNLNLLSPLGLNYLAADKKRWTENLLNLNEEECLNIKTKFDKDLESKGIDGARKFIFIHPGMVGHTLNWSSRNYGRFIVRMEKEFPGQFNFVVSFTPVDIPYLEGLRDHLSKAEHKDHYKNIYFFDGSKNGLRYSMGVIKAATVFIGPSTGPTHLANDLGVKSVGIYSPIKVQSASRWGPINRDKKMTRIVSPDVICGEQFECAGDICPYFECMGKIEVEDIFAQVKSLIEG